MTNNRFESLAVPPVRDLKPYEPGKPIEELERQYGVSNIVKLASNENPLGTSPKALAAISALGSGLALYPDPNGFHLKRALAEKHRVDAECVTLGNGSNDVLVLLAEVFLNPDFGGAYPEYSFAVYPIATQATGARHQVAPAQGAESDQPYGADLQALRAVVDDSTRLLFIANPNNPTGTWVEPMALRSLIADLPEHVIVVVDEAYVEYGEPSTETADRWLKEFPNLVVTRTFSKAYGLAGLRIGYALSHPDIADLLNRVRPAFNVNSVALAAARAALHDFEFLQRSKLLNDKGLEQLYRGFDRLGLAYVRSHGNFVMVDVGRPAGNVYESLLRQGVIVRPIGGYGLPNHLRITVGTPDQNELLLNALENSLS